MYKNRYSDAPFFQNGLKILNATISTNEPQNNINLIYLNFINALKSLGLPICDIKFASSLIDLKNMEELPNGIDLVNFLLQKTAADIYLAENTLVMQSK